MPLSEFFRGLMGLPPQQPDQNNNRDPWGNDLFYELFRDFTHMVDETNRLNPPSQRRSDEQGETPTWAPYEDESFSQDDFGFHLFHQTDDMFRHFEEQFKRTFQGFGLMEFPAEFGPPPLEAPPAEPGTGGATSLRDRMLKSAPSGRAAHTDADLDDRVSEGGLSTLLDEVPPHSEAAPPAAITPFRGFSSSSFSGHVGPGAHVEQRRVETGADGEQRVTVTRRIGDQQQTTVTVQRPDGSTEVEQHLTNMEQDEVPRFERQWQNPSGQDVSPGVPHRPGFDESFWRRLFG